MAGQRKPHTAKPAPAEDDDLPPSFERILKQNEEVFRRLAKL